MFSFVSHLNCIVSYFNGRQVVRLVSKFLLANILSRRLTCKHGRYLVQLNANVWLLTYNVLRNLNASTLQELLSVVNVWFLREI
jgi:hypothetical protein